MCVHMSGIPSGCCALCSNSVIERSSGFSHKEDDKPRLLKGRDRTEWVGLGQHHSIRSTSSSRAAAREGNVRTGSWAPKTEWGREQSRRSIEEFRKLMDQIGSGRRDRSILREW